MVNWDNCGKENSSSLSTDLQTYHATLAHLGDVKAANNLGGSIHSKSANCSMHRHIIMFKLES
jgi:hypothetical protein